MNSDLARESGRRDTENLLILFLTATVILSIFHFTVEKKYSPEPFGEEFVKNLRDKSYDRASDFFIDIPYSVLISSRDILGALKSKYDKASDIRIKSCEKTQDINKYSLTVEVMEGKDRYTEAFSMVNTIMKPGYKKDWKIIFPLKTQDVTVKGFDSSMVFIDGREVGQISGGRLDISGILPGIHEFKSAIDGVGESDSVKIDVGDYNNEVGLSVKPSNEFKRSMEKLLSDFCTGWSKYCMTQDINAVKPYLTHELCDFYDKDKDRFNGSRYVRCQGTQSFGEFNLEDENSVSLVVDEKWDQKEVATSSNIIFKDNGKDELEQVQYITWKYYITRDQGAWKIYSAEQESFKQEIK